MVGDPPRPEFPDFALPDLLTAPARPAPPPKEKRVDIALRNEVKNQCFRARLAGDRLEFLAGTDSIPYDVDQPNGVESAIVSHAVDIQTQVHTILSAAGIVARILDPKPAPRDACDDPNPPAAKAEAIRRARAAFTRAQAIWRTWPLPRREDLGPLWDRSTRNAIEHMENEAPEWFSGRDEYPLLGWAMGMTPPSGKASGSRGAFRLLFQDSLRLKVGSSFCSIREILGALKLVEDALPTTADLRLNQVVMVPFRRGPSGEIRWVNQCPLPRRGEGN